MAAKGIQLWFWPSFDYASALTVLTGYHTGFALVYLSSLGLVSYCCRRIEESRAKIRDTGVMDADDARDWNAFTFKAANWMARRRAFRKHPFTTGVGWEWAVDLFIALTHP